MIGKLRGRVDEVFEDAVLVDVGGVGYHVFASARTLATVAPGRTSTLVIETHVREDHIHLYGFSTAAERDWFKLLMTVQRVGAKMAMTILSAYSPEQLSHAIVAKDMAAFSRISGVGAKLAERIVSELKDKISKLSVVRDSLFVVRKEGKTGLRTTNNEQRTTEDAISALVNLGYTRSEAYAAAIKAAQSGKNLDDIIKLSLKELAHG